MGAALFLIIGLVAIGIGLWQGWSTVQMMHRSVTTTGHVVASPGTPGRSSAHPLVEFATTNGTIVRYRQNGMGERPVGDAVPLLYDPADPKGTAIARGFWQLWFSTLAPLLLGCAFVALVWKGVAVEWRGGRY